MRAEERQLNGATERYGERQPQICCWMVLCCYPHPTPTAPFALPAAGAVKIYLSYKFCGASLSLSFSTARLLREQSQAQSQKNI